MVIVVGADVHKATHTFVAVDEVGRKLGEKHGEGDDRRVMTGRCGGREPQFGDELRWGIEDCRHLSARLERDLLAGGQEVVRVPPKLMAQTRAPRRGTEASPTRSTRLAVARAVLREPGSAGGVARRGDAGAEAAGRSQRRPGQRTNPADQPAALAPARTRPRVRGPDRRSLRTRGRSAEPCRRLADRSTTVWSREIARDIARRHRPRSRGKIDALGEADHRAASRTAPAPARDARLRGADRGEDRRRDRRT